MKERWRAAAVVVSLLMPACSGANGAAEETTTTAASTTTAGQGTTTTLPATSTTPEPPVLAVDRLVIVSAEGEVVSMDRTGARRVIHSESGDVPMQPIFDPSGGRISYSLLGPTPALVVAAADGTGRELTELSSNPFYLYWSHDGRRLASLRNVATGLAFEIFDVSGATTSVEFMDEGAPYYFDWSPQGADLVAHVGTDRLDLWAGDAYSAAGPAPGFFSAPQWLPAGVLLPIDDSGEQQMAFMAADGSVTPLADFEGSARFEVESSVQRLLAFQTLTEPTDAISAAFQIVETWPSNELLVVDLETGQVEFVHDAPVGAFFWSPFGERLLFLTAGPSQGALQWHVWEDGDTTAGPEFVPYRQWFSSFIPFFEQYSRSMSLWAPDGSAFAYPGVVGEEAGVWVYDVTEAQQDLVAEGIWVSWSQN